MIHHRLDQICTDKNFNINDSENERRQYESDEGMDDSSHESMNNVDHINIKRKKSNDSFTSEFPPLRTPELNSNHEFIERC